MERRPRSFFKATELGALKTYLDDNLKKGFIQPSTSPAGAGIFFVQKKDHSLRPCVDYRALNKVTVKNRYPLPLVPELFQRLGSARVFSKLDLRGAYNLVRIRKGDEWKTAFRTRFGHYEYLVMPFGLCNAPATFQHFVNDVFREYLDLFVVIYLDDILIFSSSLAEHREHVKIVLARLRLHGLYAKPEKCVFEQQSIQFLGLIISVKGIEMDPQKVSAILDWPAPSDRKGVQRFVEFANFYRKFIRGFSSIISPITELTKQGQRFLWTPKAQEAFETLKKLFVSASILRHPDATLPYILEVDASEVAVGAVLSQRQGPKSLLYPVAFFSRKLSEAERNYDVGDRELLAIKAALEEWRYLLEGASHPILVYTDHKNLEYLKSAKRLKPRQARWALFFSRFVFHITYRPGSKNVKPDALSRMYNEPTELGALKTYLDDNLKKGFIQPSTSPAGAGIFFVQKKDHSLRPCVDYRALNKVTVKNRYPLPLVPELFQRLGSARVFSKLDLRGAYNLVRIRKGDEWKTAFRTRFGHYEYLVMPFGLCNAPATFQHFVNDVFREYLDLFVVIYLDDILIFSSSLAEHREHVKIVLARLRLHGLYAKPEKCVFEQQSIQFLGLIISVKGIEMDPQKVSAILDWPAPSDRKGVQRFVGFANFYRKFIRGFSSIISPITELTKQGQRFLWTPKAQEAFETLKKLFVSASILRHPDATLPYILEVDASEVAVGAVLSQRQGPKSLLYPVAFFSRKLSEAERNYDVGDRELLAIKAALEEWRYLLEGASHPILVYTDHKNLEYLKSAKRLKPRQARWALFFSRFVFHITYRPGSKNVKPDALSRMYNEPPNPNNLNHLEVCKCTS
ncbi:uncharacterized protein LOC143925677 [Lithobates pipiens]